MSIVVIPGEVTVRMWQATMNLRFVVPDATTTDRPKLQQQWHDRKTGDTQWRTIPTAVVPLQEFYGL